MANLKRLSLKQLLRRIDRRSRVANARLHQAQKALEEGRLALTRFHPLNKPLLH